MDIEREIKVRDEIEMPTELRNRGFAEKILPPLQKILKKELNENIYYFKTNKKTK